jgi:hypothetical protein
MMDHPNIAKVFDAGTTELGRPYFVMELVRGIKITDYCNQANLTTKERLDLFIKVCEAIQHAHQKGIIHRDIKPSNILVTLHDGVPVPKVIDFGIAKATEGRLTDATVYTLLHQFIGTPAYMAIDDFLKHGIDANPDWVRLYARDSEREVHDWLVALGVGWSRLFPRLPGNSVQRQHEAKGRGVGLVSPIYRECLRWTNIHFVWNTKVTALLIEEGHRRTTGSARTHSSVRHLPRIGERLNAVR